MKKKLLCFLLAVCLILPCAFSLSACKEEPETPETPPEAQVVYTVTEEEWRINFNLTKGQGATPQSVKAEDTRIQAYASTYTEPISAITSYTISAVGVNTDPYAPAPINGTCLLKVAPNAMSIEFRLEGVLREDESGITPSTDAFYQGLTASVMSYFPFADQYDSFTFDETKKAYVAQNFTSIIVNEEDINETYPLYTKSAEVTFINGYLNTVTVELTTDNTYQVVYSSFAFTFSDINSTVVDLNG